MQRLEGPTGVGLGVGVDIPRGVIRGRHVVTELKAQRLRLRVVMVLAVVAWLMRVARIKRHHLHRQRITGPPTLSRRPHSIDARHGSRRRWSRAVLLKRKGVAQIVNRHTVHHHADHAARMPDLRSRRGRVARDAHLIIARQRPEPKQPSVSGEPRPHRVGG